MSTINPPIYLHQNIKYLRKRMNLSQEELAQRVGLNRGNIASYEKGIAEPKLCNLLKLSYIFRVSVRDLTERELSKLNGSLIKLQDNFKPTVPIEHLDQHVKQAEELQTVVSSLYNCHCYKVKNIDSNDKDVQVLVSNFEQLYDVTHRLLESHKQLVEFMSE